VLEAVAELKSSLAERQKVEEISLSKVSSTLASQLLENLDIIVLEDDSLDDGVEPVHFFKSFGWPSGDEVKDCGAAVRHLQTLLSQAGVAFGRGGYQLVDVQDDRKLLDLTLGSKHFKGTCDAILVPYNVAAESFPQQLRVVFECKLPAFIQNLSGGQWFAELLTASRHRVLVVFTDLSTTFHMWQLRCDLLPSPSSSSSSAASSSSSSASTTRLLTIAKFWNVQPRVALAFIRNFINNECSPSPTYQTTAATQDGNIDSLVRAILLLKEKTPSIIQEQLESLVPFESPFDRLDAYLDLFFSCRTFD